MSISKDLQTMVTDSFEYLVVGGRVLVGGWCR